MSSFKDELFDMVTHTIVQANFQRLGRHLYNADSLKSLVAFGLPRRSGTQPQDHFEYFSRYEAEPELKFDFHNWRSNPWYKCDKSEPSHYRVTVIKKAINEKGRTFQFQMKSHQISFRLNFKSI